LLVRIKRALVQQLQQLGSRSALNERHLIVCMGREAPDRTCSLFFRTRRALVRSFNNLGGPLQAS
jgi:hypothetical protein